MSTLLEDPNRIVLYGASIELVLLVALLATRRGVLLFVMAGAALLTVLAVVVEGMVVTERERVEAVIYEGAAALEANDLNRVLAVIAPSAARSRSEAQWALKKFRLREVSVRGLEITVDLESDPPTAHAEFDARISGDDLSGQAPYGTFFGGFEVWFERHDDRWLLVRHEIKDRPHYLIQEKRR